MPSAFELMLQGGLTDADRQRLLAQQLRNRRQTGELALLTGDRVLAPLGEGLVNEALDKEGTSLNIQANEVAAGENTRRFGLEQAMLGRRQTEVERHNRAMEEIGRLTAARARLGVQNQFDNNVRRLSESMTRLGIPELKQDVAAVSDLLAKHEGEDLPGFGATSVLPDAMLSNEGVEFRQAVARVRNKLLKIRSGAAVTDPEMARLADELGAKLGGTDREIRLAWPDIMAGIQAIESGIVSGFDPEVVETFESRFNDRQGGGDPESPAPVTRPAPVNPPVSAPASGGKRIKWTDL